MRKVTSLDFESKPVKASGLKAAERNWQAAQKRQKDFVPLCKYFEDVDGWQVCYGDLRRIALRIMQQFRDPVDRDLFLKGEYRKTSWGLVKLRAVRQKLYTSGGELWYNGNRIFDVRSFFMQAPDATFKAYGTTSIPEIMERTRAELSGVDLRAFQNHWFRNSSIADYLLRKMKVDVNGIPGRPFGNPQQYIGSSACGFIEGPIYEYDLVSAFASALLDVPELSDFVRALDNARRGLSGKPSARILKVTQSVLPGKLASPDSRYYHPNLAAYVRGNTRERLVDAMNEAVYKGGTVFRWNIDGFFTNADLSGLLPINGTLGGWKETVHDWMLILDTNVFRTNLKNRNNGYIIPDWEVMRENPINITLSRPFTNWTTLQEEVQVSHLRFENGHHNCGLYCYDEVHLKREGFDQWFV